MSSELRTTVKFEQVYSMDREGNNDLALSLVGQGDLVFRWEDLYYHYARVHAVTSGVIAKLELHAYLVGFSKDWMSVATAPNTEDGIKSLIALGDRLISQMAVCPKCGRGDKKMFVDESGVCRTHSENPRKWQPRGL